jgi:hypothetical protein
MNEAITTIAIPRETPEILKTWAAKLFDPSIVDALPLTSAKKKFSKITFTEAVAFFTKL